MVNEFVAPLSVHLRFPYVKDPALFLYILSYGFFPLHLLSELIFQSPLFSLLDLPELLNLLIESTAPIEKKNRGLALNIFVRQQLFLQFFSNVWAIIKTSMLNKHELNHLIL